MFSVALCSYGNLINICCTYVCEQSRHKLVWSPTRVHNIRFTVCAGYCPFAHRIMICAVRYFFTSFVSPMLLKIVFMPRDEIFRVLYFLSNVIYFSRVAVCFSRSNMQLFNYVAAKWHILIDLTWRNMWQSGKTKSSHKQSEKTGPRLTTISHR